MEMLKNFMQVHNHRPKSSPNAPNFMAWGAYAPSRVPSGALAGHVASGYEIVGALGRIANAERSESVEPVDLVRVLRDAASESEARAGRHGRNL